MEAANEAGLSALFAALTATNVIEDATADGTIVTIFAPVNSAFDSALEALGVTLDDLLENMDLLKEIILYHVLPDPLTLADFGGHGTFMTLLGDSSPCGVGHVDVEAGKNLQIIGGQTTAQAVVVDIRTCSAIVHVIDTVLLPCPFDASGPQPPADDELMPQAPPPMTDKTGMFMEDEFPLSVA